MKSCSYGYGYTAVILSGIHLYLRAKICWWKVLPVDVNHCAVGLYKCPQGPGCAAVTKQRLNNLSKLNILGLRDCIINRANIFYGNGNSYNSLEWIRPGHEAGKHKWDSYLSSLFYLFIRLQIDPDNISFSPLGNILTPPFFGGGGGWRFLGLDKLFSKTQKRTKLLPRHWTNSEGLILS